MNSSSARVVSIKSRSKKFHYKPPVERPPNRSRVIPQKTGFEDDTYDDDDCSIESMKRKFGIVT